MVEYDIYGHVVGVLGLVLRALMIIDPRPANESCFLSPTLCDAIYTYVARTLGPESRACAFNRASPNATADDTASTMVHTEVHAFCIG